MRAVFHHSNDDSERHTRVVNNIRNLLDDETVDVENVTLVANSGGIRLLTTDSPQKARIERLLEAGVSVKQCRNTLTGSGLTETDLIDGVELVAAGVGELTRLQAEGYAYLKP